MVLRYCKLGDIDTLIISMIIASTVFYFVTKEPFVAAFVSFNSNHLRPHRPNYYSQDMMLAAPTAASDSSGDELIHTYESPFFSIEAENQLEIPAALIILNTPIVTNRVSNDGRLAGALNILWQKSSYRVCADGGANRLYEATIINASNTTYLPDLITGDLDSLFPHVRKYYEQRGVPIIRVEDQDYHDLDKSLMAVENWIDNIVTTNTRPASLVRAKIFVYGGFGGRFDQEMACINALYAWGMKEKFRCTSMALYGEETCAFLLSAAPAVNEIRIMFPEDGNCTRKKSNGQLIGEGPSCGLIPLGNRCNDVITTGLKWNLNGDIPLEFGGLVSSSNRIMNEVVTVRTSAPMIFTTEMLNKS